MDDLKGQRKEKQGNKIFWTTTNKYINITNTQLEL